MAAKMEELSEIAGSMTALKTRMEGGTAAYEQAAAAAAQIQQDTDDMLAAEKEHVSLLQVLDIQSSMHTDPILCRARKRNSRENYFNKTHKCCKKKPML